MKHLTLDMGALSPSIAEQLAAQGLSFDGGAAAIWQRDADAVTRLCLHSLIPDSVAHRARQRIIDRIAKTLHTPLTRAPGGAVGGELLSPGNIEGID